MSLFSEIFCFPLPPTCPSSVQKTVFQEEEEEDEKKLKYSFIVLVLKTDFVLTINDVLV